MQGVKSNFTVERHDSRFTSQVPRPRPQWEVTLIPVGTLDSTTAPHFCHLPSKTVTPVES